MRCLHNITIQYNTDRAPQEWTPVGQQSCSQSHHEQHHGFLAEMGRQHQSSALNNVQQYPEMAQSLAQGYI